MDKRISKGRKLRNTIIKHFRDNNYNANYFVNGDDIIVKSEDTENIDKYLQKLGCKSLPRESQYLTIDSFDHYLRQCGEGYYSFNVYINDPREPQPTSL